MAAVPEAWRYLRSRSAGATIGLMILPAPAPRRAGPQGE